MMDMNGVLLRLFAGVWGKPTMKEELAMDIRFEHDFLPTIIMST